MAYCYKCNKNVQLVVSVENYSNSKPRCSICYNEIKFPSIQSESDWKEHLIKSEQEGIRSKINNIEYELPFLKQSINVKLSPFNIFYFIVGIVFSLISYYFYYKYKILPPIVENYLYIFFDFIFMAISGISAFALFISCYSKSEYDVEIKKRNEAKERFASKLRELEKLKRSLK